MSWLLLHGALASADQFDTHLDHLPMAQAYTFLHHGERSDGFPFTIDQLANELHPAADVSMKVLGHSMGGYVALWLAARYHVPFQHIVCWGTKLLWTDQFLKTQERILNPDFLKERNPRFVEQLLKQHGPKWPLLLRETFTMMKKLTEDDCLRPDDFKKIKFPVTFLLGAGDRMVHQEETLEIARHFPQAKVVTCEQFGHDLPLAVDLLPILESEKLI